MKCTIAVLTSVLGFASIARPDQTDRILTALNGSLSYDTPDKSFSPFYSDIGLGFAGDAGISSLYLHYNRKTTTLGGPFLAAGDDSVETSGNVLSVHQQSGSGALDYVFFGRNSWLVECDSPRTLSYRFTSEKNLTEARSTFNATSRVFLFDGYLPTADARDVDRFFPIAIGLRVLAGEITAGDGLSRPLVIQADKAGRIRLAFSVQILAIDHPALERVLLAAPTGPRVAHEESLRWFRTAIGGLDFGDVGEKEARVLSLAATTLAFNSCEAPGNLAGRIAQFPSRGSFPTHYLWDACFQALALERMEPRLAEDAMLLLVKTMRSDGKMAQFVCSTWARPDGSQPPLAAWATWNIYQARRNPEFAKAMLPGLVRNIDWWLTQRMTAYGIIGTYDRHETGCDNTPRLDQGPVLAVDMNSYLLMAMTACGELATAIGDRATANRMETLARPYAKKMVDLLYDPEAGIFRDVLIETGEKVNIVTPASLLPLLARVPIEREKAEAMIRKYLLNPKKLFGKYPFPSVAYDEPTYEPRNQARGPTWMPTVYMMLQVLKMYGFDDAYAEAKARAYDMVLRDGRIMEKFDSQTGEGIGHTQQGWTAAIFLRLILDAQEVAVSERPERSAGH